MLSKRGEAQVSPLPVWHTSHSGAMPYRLSTTVYYVERGSLRISSNVISMMRGSMPL